MQKDMLNNVDSLLDMLHSGIKHKGKIYRYINGKIEPKIEGQIELLDEKIFLLPYALISTIEGKNVNVNDEKNPIYLIFQEDPVDIPPNFVAKLSDIILTTYPLIKVEKIYEVYPLEVKFIKDIAHRLVKEIIEYIGLNKRYLNVEKLVSDLTPIIKLIMGEIYDEIKKEKSMSIVEDLLAAREYMLRDVFEGIGLCDTDYNVPDITITEYTEYSNLHKKHAIEHIGGTIVVKNLSLLIGSFVM